MRVRALRRRSHARALQARGRADDGFSMVELVVAMLVLGTLSMVVVGLVLQTQSMSESNRSRVAAANLAAREIDIVREEFTRDADAPAEVADEGTVTNPHQLTGQVQGKPLGVDGTAYTVRRSSSWNLVGSGSSPCEGGSLVNYPTLRVAVQVSWKGMGTVAPVTTTALLAPKKDDKVVGTHGYVAVRVTNAAGAANPGRSVIVYSSTESRTGVTDSSGCAVVQVNPAAAGTLYSAKLSNLGYVDISGVSEPVKSVGLVERGKLNNNTTFAYDVATKLRIRFVNGTGHLVPDGAVVGQPYTLVASEYAGASGAKLLVADAATVVLEGLWPTQYGAYFGTVPPAGGYATVSPGGPGIPTIDVVVP
ncbi:type IV pilus modification PilV family protein [Cellulomonas rhizosphaerae]|uniref:Prepilin-type N-terminal cleavage/methylation domain-containing protein n=1 Tax=Cellulomonas rhizosphaerae TaxID=2293719 RepID=A0A413RLB2_9CELL|nr:prepilin-type N-terminal cleavage/methylation domain-containing protein [Cellulomonas rhizosphaerae]RHA40533.1 prepilin-type N-terminal cleavage/methylation domain-containing protein [Cellulomonas rhizosphaerae]